MVAPGRPGGPGRLPLGNGGAFGAKISSPVASDAERLGHEIDSPVRVVWSRPDVVRFGPKRPPLAAGLTKEGSGVWRVAWTPGSPDPTPYVEAVRSVAPGVRVDVVEVPGPVVSTDLRGAGWIEAAAMVAVLSGGEDPAGSRGWAGVSGPSGGRAEVGITDQGTVEVDVWAGEVLDAVVLRSYCIGAVHQALGLVRSEAIAVDDDGQVQDLTIRSFGIMTAAQMPEVEVTVHPGDHYPVNGSDAVLAAAAAAAWKADGLVPQWPTARERSRRSPARPASAEVT